MSVDLTLPPSSSPTIDPYKDVPDGLLPFALYVHVKLADQNELVEIERQCNSQIEGCNGVERAPRFDFTGQPLRAALDEHLNNVISARRFDPFYFVAVVDEDWRKNGVLLVTMDDGRDEETSYIDQMKVPVDEAGLLLVNMQIANVDWSEYKEGYEEDNEENDDDDDGNKGNGDDDGKGDDEEGKGEKDDSSAEFPYDKPQTDEEYSDGSSATLPNVGYWIGLYAVPEIDYEKIMRGTHPGWGPQCASSELMCRPQGRVPAASPESMVAEAARLHPMRCRNNPHLHGTMFLIADTPTYEQDGLLLVQLEWDEKQASDKTKSLSDLAQLGQAAKTDTKRLPFEMGTTLTKFNMIKAGYSPWKHTHKTFMAYAGPKITHAEDYLPAVDKSFSRRVSGSEKFVNAAVYYPQTLRPEEGVIIDDAATLKGLQVTVDQHKDFLHRERFRDNMCPDYFIFHDTKLGAKDAKMPITLVQVLPDAKWSTMQCPAGTAYAALCDIVDNKRAWEDGATVAS